MADSNINNFCLVEFEHQPKKRKWMLSTKMWGKPSDLKKKVRVHLRKRSQNQACWQAAWTAADILAGTRGNHCFTSVNLITVSSFLFLFWHIFGQMLGSWEDRSRCDLVQWKMSTSSKFVSNPICAQLTVVDSAWVHGAEPRSVNSLVWFDYDRQRVCTLHFLSVFIPPWPQFQHSTLMLLAHLSHLRIARQKKATH